MFKIKNMNTGLFSTGGTAPTFTKNGKTWTNRGGVSSHLAQLSKQNISDVYSDCEVIEYEFTEVDSVDSFVKVTDWTLAKSTIVAKQREKERRLEWVASQKKYKTVQDIKALEAELKRLRGLVD